MCVWRRAGESATSFAKERSDRFSGLSSKLLAPADPPSVAALTRSSCQSQSGASLAAVGRFRFGCRDGGRLSIALRSRTAALERAILPPRHLREITTCAAQRFSISWTPAQDEGEPGPVPAVEGAKRVDASLPLPVSCRPETGRIHQIPRPAGLLAMYQTERASGAHTPVGAKAATDEASCR